MKKNYFYALLAALFMALPATAQMTSVTDFFGKWQFTADVEVLNQDYAETISNSCEVVIAKGENGFPAKMTGFAGATSIVNINSFDAEAQTLLFLNPNSPQLWSPLSMADAEGKYPYGTAEGQWKDTYGSINFTYDAAKKVLTYPNFTLVTCNHSAGTTEIMVKVTNIQMTLTEKEEIEVPKIAGEWKFKPYSMNYVRNDSTCAYEFTMNLTAKDEANRTYDATIDIEGFNSFTLPATFDGVTLVIPFDGQYLDAEKKIRLGAKASTAEAALEKKGQLSFSYESSTLMWQGDDFIIRQEGTTTEIVNGEEVTKEVAPMIQRVSYGWIEREDPNAYDWSGVYKVNVSEVENLKDDATFPAEFEMVIEKKPGNTYAITKMLGFENLGITITPASNDKTATIELGGGYYGFTMLKFIGEVDGDYAYYALTDGNGESTSIVVTKNDDGTLSLADFSVSHYLYTTKKYDPLAAFYGAKAAKKVYDWAGEYTLTAKIEDADSIVNFDVAITKSYDGSYFITKFDGDKVYNLNYGGIKLTFAEDNKTATFNNGGRVGGAYPEFITINNADATATTIELAMDAAGNIAMSSFMYKEVNYDTQESADLATYSNVVLTRKPFGLSKATPSADDKALTTVYNINLTFNKEVVVTFPEGGFNVVNTATQEVIKVDSVDANTWIPKNQVAFLFEKKMAPGKDGKDELQDQWISTPGNYSYTIPAGVIKSVDGEEFPETTFTFTIVGTIDIADYSPKETASLDEIVVTFNNEITEVDLSKSIKVYNLYWSPMATVSSITISDDKKSAVLKLDTPLTTVGSYNVELNKGTFISAEGISNYKSLAVNVIDPTPRFITNYSDGDKVKALSNVLEITFQNVNAVELADDASFIVYTPGNDELEGTAVKKDGKIEVTFEGEFTEVGIYTFQVSAGAFTMDGVANKERLINVELYTFEIVPLQVVSVTPAAGEVDQIEKIVVKYNQIVQLSFDADWQQISREIVVTCGDEEIPFVYAPETWSATDEIVYLANGEWSNETNSYVGTPIVTEGTYTLNLADIVVDHAAEMITDQWGTYVGTWHMKNQHCEGTYSWTVKKDDSAIAEIEAAEGEQGIYDLMGRKIDTITVPGLYIVNGKKVVIK